MIKNYLLDEQGDLVNTLLAAAGFKLRIYNYVRKNMYSFILSGLLSNCIRPTISEGKTQNWN